MMNKRGLSNVIVTLILIAISLIAVGLVWVTVQNLIESETEQISLGFITVDLEIKDVKVESDGSVKISVGRKIGDGDITGLKFIVSDGINTETIDKENINLDQLEEKTFTLTSGELGEVVFVKEISVAPIFTLESGKEKIGNVVDNEVLTNKQIIENLGAVSWWRFEGNARDEIGDNDGIFIRDPELVEGKYGQAYYFDGSDTNKYIEIANFPKIQNEATISMWVKVNGQDNNWEDLFYIGGDRRIETRLIGDKGMWCQGPSALNLWETNEWFHIVCSFTTTSKEGFINGESKMSAGGSGLPWDAGPLKMGTVLSGQTFDGTLDEVMIFNKALTDKEIKALYELDLS